MLISMTGYGNGKATEGGITANAEIRSVNNRFFEFSARLPKHLQPREGELKEIVRSKAQRGKINLTVSVEREGIDQDHPSFNFEVAEKYWALLQELAERVGSTEPVSLDVLLKFPDVFTAEDTYEADATEWQAVVHAVLHAAETLATMRSNEGRELTTDLHARCVLMNETIDTIESLFVGRLAQERTKLHERVQQLVTSDKINAERLELEIILLADKMDITEELVRFRSHMKFFLQALEAKESEGRKLSFLLQELNREANTISSKSSDATISQYVVTIKEELERIREQIQNIE